MSVLETLADDAKPNSVLAVSTGRAILFANGESSAIHKSSVSSVSVGVLGFAGDEHGDPKRHGGAEKAVHQYPIEHYRHWAAQGIDAGLLDAPGTFGENITSIGMTEDTVCVGDVYRVGDDGVVLQVSQTRVPCWKLGVRFKRPTLAADVQHTGRTGWHYRVLSAGTITAEDSFVLVERPHPAWTLSRLTHALFVDKMNREDLAEIAALSELSDSLKETASKRLDRSAVESWEERLTGVRDSKK